MMANIGLLIGVLAVSAGAWVNHGFGIAAIVFGAAVWITSIITAGLALVARRSS